MSFRLVPPVLVLVLAGVRIAAAAPAAGKVDDLVEQSRGLLNDGAAPPAHRHHRKASKSKLPAAPPADSGTTALGTEPPAPAPAGPKPPAEPQHKEAEVRPARVEAAEPPQAIVVSPIPSPAERVRRGKNDRMQGTAQSPLARLGIPLKAVPAVATATALGFMTVWPFLSKTLTVLFKGLVAGLLKKRVKKGKKVNLDHRQFVLLGFHLRPAELAALFLGAVVYGLAVCYALKGWQLDSGFLLRQELLVLLIYGLRSFIRFLYERVFGIVTQFRFWLAGSLLCLGSAILGNTLHTVGYELEATDGKEAAQRVVKMKAWLIIAVLFMAVDLCIANLWYPERSLQSARLITSGMALAEVLPVAPMPGLAIYKWRRSVWLLLFLLVVPAFFLMNFFL